MKDTDTAPVLEDTVVEIDFSDPSKPAKVKTEKRDFDLEELLARSQGQQQQQQQQEQQQNKQEEKQQEKTNNEQADKAKDTPLASKQEEEEEDDVEGLVSQFESKIDINKTAPHSPSALPTWTTTKELVSEDAGLLQCIVMTTEHAPRGTDKTLEIFETLGIRIKDEVEEMQSMWQTTMFSTDKGINEAGFCASFIGLLKGDPYYKKHFKAKKNGTIDTEVPILQQHKTEQDGSHAHDISNHLFLDTVIEWKSDKNHLCAVVIEYKYIKMAAVVLNSHTSNRLAVGSGDRFCTEHQDFAKAKKVRPDLLGWSQDLKKASSAKIQVFVGDRTSKSTPLVIQHLTDMHNVSMQKYEALYVKQKKPQKMVFLTIMGFANRCELQLSYR
jgi:hypothetical protein